jgi:uncharacterized repeat protein (TIGR03803 family)
MPLGARPGLLRTGQMMKRNNGPIIRLARVVLAVGCTVAMLAAPSHAESGFTLTTLVSFSGTNGADPHARLAWGMDGSLYGTTLSGGNFNLGTVFRVTPAGDLATLASFDGTNGAYPRAGLAQNTNGEFAFYGTASSGGSSNLGTVFRFTTNGVLSPLVSFAGTNGANPHADLVLSGDGSFYGTTYFGGTNDWPKAYGTVFRVTTNGALTAVASFNNTNGAEPFAWLTEGTDGSLYGTTEFGGPVGFGTVFKLTPGGTPILLASFNSTNGALPYAGLAQRGDGIFYGTTYSGGLSNLGTLFQVSSNGLLTNLVSFCGTNGAGPLAGLTRGGDGNFYGTTAQGGNAGDLGTLFQTTTNGLFTTLLSFNGTNGSHPYAALVLGADGNLYGTTGTGGESGKGTVFRLSLALRTPPVFQSVTQTPGTLWLTWSTVTGLMYQMRYRTNLNQTNWDDVGGPVTAAGITTTASYLIGPEPQRFYRVVLLP